MGIFSTIGNLGLGDFDESKILDNDSGAAARRGAAEQKETKSPEELEKEALFDKTYECPICNLTFKTKCVRAGKVRLESKDTDLRPIYNHIDPIKYDVITCEKCGYSALGRYFGKLMNRQIRDISEQIGSKFNGIEPAIQKENAHVLTDTKGAIEIKDVNFSYVKDKTLITNLNLSVKPGMRVAIVGPTGCGKSTLINLLMLFYDVDTGSISVDGTDIRDMTRDSLRHL